jgi:ISXO2-like transposase domain
VNSAEGFFSIFKRGMTGIYQHCGEQHLHRYLAEFDFRYSNRIKLGVDDTERTRRASRELAGSASPIGGLVAKTPKPEPPEQALAGRLALCRARPTGVSLAFASSRSHH